MARSSSIAELLLLWEERHEQGVDVSLEELCRECPDLLEPLRERVAALQAAPPVVETFSSLTSTFPSIVREDAPLPEIPGYEILEEIGRGGMGVVYQARHLALGRLVALKLIRSPGLASAVEMARFQAEAVAIARMRHPNIVQVYDIGVHKGVPYFALEYVAGGSFDRRLAGRPLAFRLAAEITATLARAIHYAHEQGVVHRDLKPGNVLVEAQGVGEDSAAASVKITDFGLAKFIAEEDSGQTATGAILGTPSYMAPEQAGGAGGSIGPSADVYALGAILYELLTGRPPFRAETRWDTLSQVVAQEPVPPSRLQPKIPSDLESICLRCLDKEPTKRYGSAALLAEDLSRFLDGRPTLARPAGQLERAVKWTRRRPTLAALLVVSVLGALALLTMGAFYSLDLRRANESIRKERDHVEAAEKTVRKQFEKSRRALFDLQLAFVKIVHDKEPSRGLALLDDGERCPEDLRDFRWALFRQFCKRDRVIAQMHREGRSLALLRGGSVVALTDAEGRLRVYDTDLANEELSSRINVAGRRVLCVAGNPSWSHLIGGCEDGSLAVYDVDSPAPAVILPSQREPITAVRCSADGTIVVSVCRGGVLMARTLPGGNPRILAEGLAGAATLAMTAEGKRVAVACNAEIRIFEVASGKELPKLEFEGKLGVVTGLAYSLDGSRLVACNQDGVVRWWDAADMRPQGRFEVPRTILWGLSVSPDNRSVAIAGMDGVIRVVDFTTGRETLILTGQTGPVWQIQYSADGASIASLGHDGSVRIWSVKPPVEAATFDGGGVIFAAAASPDGEKLAVGGKKGRIALWDLKEGKLLKTLGANKGAITALLHLQDGAMVSAHGNGDIRVVDLESDANSLLLKGHKGAALALAASPNGKFFASSGQDGTVRFWNRADKIEVWKREFDGILWSVALSPDGKTFAVGGSNGNVWFGAVDGEETFELPRRKGGILTVAFSPDGQTLATGGLDRAIDVWDWKQRNLRTTLTGPRTAIRSIAFSPDGGTLASVGSDGNACLWDLAAEQEFLSLTMPSESANGVLFAPNGAALVAFGDSRIYVWNVNPRKTP